MALSKSYLNQQGVSTKADLIRLSRTQSVKEKVGSTMNKGKTIVSRTTKYESLPSVRGTQSTYDECVTAIIRSLRGMNTSEDVQNGIYL